MLYELSVYLLNGFRSSFLGGTAGAFLSFVLFHSVSSGLVVGALLGLGGGIFVSFRHLQAEHLRRSEQLADGTGSVWPPEPEYHPQEVLAKGKTRPTIFRVVGIAFLCLLMLVIGVSIYIHFELLRECAGHYGGLCAP